MKKSIDTKESGVEKSVHYMIFVIMQYTLNTALI